MTPLTPEQIAEIRARLASGHYPPGVGPTDDLTALLSHIDHVTRERDEAERLREFDTGTRELPKGVMLEHNRLDAAWQKMLKERDEAKSEARALSAQVERLQERVALTSIVGKRAIDAADVKIARLERILAAEQGREGLEGWAYNPTLHAWSRDGASIIRLSDGSNNPWKLTEGESVCTVSHYATAYAAMVSHKEYNALTGRIAEAALAEGAS
jgi:hypothetical protein